MVILMVGESQIGKKLSEKWNKAGHRVIRAAGAEETGELLKREEQIDLFVAAPDFFAEREDLQADLRAGIEDGPDWKGAEKLYASCAIEPLQALQEAVLVMERGGLKRICFLNPVRGSLNASADTAGYGVSMCAHAVNMQVNLLFNRLRPLGYTFRLFGIRENMDAAVQAEAAYWYFTKDRSVDPESAKHEDENRLVMRDPDGREVPF